MDQAPLFSHHGVGKNNALAESWRVRNMVDQLLSHVPLSLHVFMGLAALTILGAGGVAFSTNIVYSAFSDDSHPELIG